MKANERDAGLAALSTEVALLCAKNDVVSWADARATKRLGVTAGARFDAVAMPGTEAKVHALIIEAAARDVPRVELSFLAHGKPVTFAFHGKPFEGGGLLVGHLLSADEQATFGHVAATMSDLGVLQRESERQRTEIATQFQNLVDSTRRIRERPDGHAPVLIALTGYGRSEDRDRSLTAGFDAHLVKPIDLGALLRTVTRLIIMQSERTLEKAG